MTINRDLNQTLVPYFQKVINFNDQIFKRFLTEKALLILLLIWTPAILVQTLDIQHSDEPMVHWVSKTSKDKDTDKTKQTGGKDSKPVRDENGDENHDYNKRKDESGDLNKPGKGDENHDPNRDIKGGIAGTVVGASVAIIAVAAEATAAVTIAPAVAAGVVVWWLVRSFL